MKASSVGDRKIPIEEQLQIAEKMIKELWGVLKPEEKQQALGLRKFLIWVKDNPDIMNAARDIYRDEAVKKVRAAFPDAKTSVRNVNDPDNDEAESGDY